MSRRRSTGINAVAWFCSQSFGASPSNGAPVAIPQVAHCRHCGRVSIGTVQRFDAATNSWRTKMACCGAEAS